MASPGTKTNKKNILTIYPKRIYTCFFISALCILPCLSPSEDAIALTTGFGLMALEEGDDRYRPGIMVQLSNGAFDTRIYYSSREFGPVFESSGLWSITGGFPVPISSWLFAHTGIAILQENTRIAYTLNDSSFDKSDTRYNLGMALGLRLKNQLTKDIHFEAGWDAFLFPAGVTGGILLSTGRKQIFYLGSGVRW